MQRGETEQRAETSLVSSNSSPIDDPRVYLAAERTFLAWVRTAVSLMGFGFLIARFALFLRVYDLTAHVPPGGRTGMSTWVGFGMVCVGVCVCFLAALRHRAYVGALKHGVANPPLNVRTSLLLAATLAAVGLAIAIHILIL
jgi:putative membrane protein